MPLSLLAFAEASRTDIDVLAYLVCAFEADRAMSDVDMACTSSACISLASTSNADPQKSHVTLIPGSMPNTSAGHKPQQEKPRRDSPIRCSGCAGSGRFRLCVTVMPWCLPAPPACAASHSYCTRLTRRCLAVCWPRRSRYPCQRAQRRAWGLRGFWPFCPAEVPWSSPKLLSEPRLSPLTVSAQIRSWLQVSSSEGYWSCRNE